MATAGDSTLRDSILGHIRVHGKECSNMDIAKAVGCGESSVRRLRPEVMDMIENGIPQTVKVADLKLDKGTQFRPALDEPTVKRYMGLETTPPPITVWDTRIGFLPEDGFHRIEVARRKGLETIEARVKDGTPKEAIAAARLANRFNGLPRCRETERNIIRSFLESPEGQKMLKESKNAVAKHLGVSWGAVEKVAAEMEGRQPKGQSARKTEAKEAPQEPQDGTDEDDQADEPAGPEKVVTEVEGDEDEDEEEEVTGHMPPTGGRPAPPARQTDEEWLSELPLAGFLTGEPRKKFDEAALTYRKAEVFLKNIKVEVDNLKLIPARKGSLNIVAFRFWSLVSMLHPRDWKVCKDCNGTGRFLDQPCPTCRTSGFHDH